jgi:hypothetical protein
MDFQSERTKASCPGSSPEAPVADAQGGARSVPRRSDVRCRDERLRRMSPERLATYERIMKLREKIGPIDFDVVEAVHELRQHG